MFKRNSKIFARVLSGILFAFLVSALPLEGQSLPGAAGWMDSLPGLRSYESERISSFDRSGGNDDRISVEPGATAVLAELSGAGILKHIWITISCPDPMLRRNAVLRMYWDGEVHPSVESPIGDFFGQGWGEKYNFTSMPVAASPGGGNALVCYFPMPFEKGARVTIENQSEKKIDAFYYYIDFEKHKSIPKETGRFHAWWHRELTEPPPGGENEWGALGEQGKNDTGRDNYLFADLEGRGHFVGVQYFVESPSPMWYGEGDDMFFIDGEPWPPSLHGTGTEDFFNSSWCPKEIYSHPLFGYARVNNETGWLGRTHCYRFFLESPIAFRKSLRATIEHGHNNCMTLDLVTVAYWYQTEPHKIFPVLPPREKRQNMNKIDAFQIHRWRDSYRRDQGGGALWGDEWKK